MKPVKAIIGGFVRYNLRMLKLYTLTPEPRALTLADLSSLDAVSRQLPQGLYSTFRTFAARTKVLGLEMHLRRLYDPLAGLAVKPAVSSAELRAALRETLKDFEAVEARVRISLSTADSPGQVYLALEPLQAPSETVYQRGVRVVLSAVKRATPRLKTTSFIGQSAGARESILNSGIYEALMVRDGRILEGFSSNFYALLGGRLVTARVGILPGVTRSFVLKLAQARGLRIEYRSLRVEEIPLLDEAFITSSGRGVVPVVEVDGQPVGLGQVGALARLLRQDYDEYVLGKAELI